MRRPLAGDVLARILANSNWTEQQQACVLAEFERAGIDSIEALENAPRMGHICGVDIYQLVQHILAWAPEYE